MDQELDRTLNQWDEKSCAEFEQYLDDLEEEDRRDESSSEVGASADRVDCACD